MSTNYTITYTLSTPEIHRKFLHLQAEFPTEGASSMQIQLPAWRPGRYELGNFAKNIRTWEATDENGRVLAHRKISKDLWVVQCSAASHITISYTYYAAELNGGSTWVSEDLLYVNPVNCFLFRPDRPDAQFDIHLDVNDSWQLATGMPKRSERNLHARGVQQLMDCPFMSAAELWHADYKSNDIPCHIWVYGKHPLSEEQLTQVFKAFTDEQIAAFGSFPVDDYHFLFLFPDQQTRHGVEHENSTVITLGPAELLTTKEGYLELLGISSHELYHTWNVKAIRPKEMMPYDFTKENYNKLGYVTEGVTTYYGDLYMIRSGIIDLATYFQLFEQKLYRHICNPGRFNMSVADSSFDTWLDGYSMGIPNRKVSIYTEGALTAFMTDVAIRKATNDKHSLDDGMRIMYERFGKTRQGYGENDYRAVLETLAGESLSEIFDHHIYGTSDYLPIVAQAFEYLGVEIKWRPRGDFAGRAGALGALEPGGYRLQIVAQNSPADQAKLAPGDLIVAVNDIQVDEHFNQRLSLEGRESLKLDVIRQRKRFSVTFDAPEEVFFLKPELRLGSEPNIHFTSWIGSKLA